MFDIGAAHGVGAVAPRLLRCSDASAGAHCSAPGGVGRPQRWRGIFVPVQDALRRIHPNSHIARPLPLRRSTYMAPSPTAPTSLTLAASRSCEHETLARIRHHPPEISWTQRNMRIVGSVIFMHQLAFMVENFS